MSTPLKSGEGSYDRSIAVAVDEAEHLAEDDGVAVVRFPRTRYIIRDVLHNPPALAGLIILLVIGLTVTLAPIVAQYHPNSIDTLALEQHPSSAHWFGTDELGRDILSRVLYGGRTSIPAGIEAVLISLAIGTTLGVLAGYVGGYLDDGIMRLMDILLAFPGILLAIGIIAIIGQGLQPAIIGLAIGGIPVYARVGRGSSLSVRELDYVAAARAQGAGKWRVLRKHIIPNVLDPLIVLATLNIGGAILAISALSFLGLGTQIPNADWGTMLSFGYEHMFQNWSGLVFPGAAIMLTVLGINLLGDGIGDALDPRR